MLWYAQQLNPTFANFNVVTPYPGTEFFRQIKDQVADFDYSRYTTYTPLMRYKHISAEQVSRPHELCTRRFFFRWPYFRDNAHLLFPILQKLGLGRAQPCAAAGEAGRSVPVARRRRTEFIPLRNLLRAGDFDSAFCTLRLPFCISRSSICFSAESELEFPLRGGPRGSALAP